MNLIEYLKSKSLCVEDVKEMNIDCNDECFICLDNIKPNEYFITPKIHEDPNFCKCKYILHLKCLKVWYRNNKWEKGRCPICRKSNKYGIYRMKKDVSLVCKESIQNPMAIQNIENESVFHDLELGERNGSSREDINNKVREVLLNEQREKNTKCRNRIYGFTLLSISILIFIFIRF